MFITRSNILLGREPTSISGENANFDPASITDPDFSTLYTGSSNSQLIMRFGQTQTINYVAVAGLNIANDADFSASVSVSDDSGLISRNFIKYNNCVVISFEARSFTNLRITLTNASQNLPTVRFIAAGMGFNVPNNGEVGGYNRQFLSRGLRSKVSLNNISGPTSYLVTRVDLKGALSLPNMTRDFSENEWQDFLSFAINNYFFVREQDPVGTSTPVGGVDTQNNSAYLCYDPTNMRAVSHPLTRALNNLSLSFRVFNGL